MSLDDIPGESIWFPIKSFSACSNTFSIPRNRLLRSRRIFELIPFTLELPTVNLNCNKYYKGALSALTFVYLSFDPIPQRLELELNYIEVTWLTLAKIGGRPVRAQFWRETCTCLTILLWVTSSLSFLITTNKAFQRTNMSSPPAVLCSLLCFTESCVRRKKRSK